MPEKGSLIRLDLDEITEEGGLLFTTRESVAKAHDSFDEKRIYVPMTTVVGEGRFPERLEKALEEAPVGEEREVLVPPSEAYGEYDPSKVEMFPRTRFLKEDVDPHPGATVVVGNRIGTVLTVTPRQVRIDFNPKGAGKSIRYRFVVREVLQSPEEKVRGILEMEYAPGRGGDFNVRCEGEEITIVLPELAKVDSRWMERKFRVLASLRRHLRTPKIRFVEEYALPDSSPKDPSASPPTP